MCNDFIMVCFIVIIIGGIILIIVGFDGVLWLIYCGVMLIVGFDMDFDIEVVDFMVLDSLKLMLVDWDWIGVVV